MKKILLGTTALAVAGFSAHAAVAAGAGTGANGVKLGVSGYYRAAYGLNFDNNYQGDNESGNNRTVDALRSDLEIWFDGETTLDNGITVGAHIELENKINEQFDKAYAFFTGSFGGIRIGQTDGALSYGGVGIPGNTINFGAQSPSATFANNNHASGQAYTGSNSIVSGLDGDANKFIYFTPTFEGFTFAISYAPSSASQEEGYTYGTNSTVTSAGRGIPNHDLEIGLNYSHDFSGIKVDASAGAGWTLSEKDKSNFHTKNNQVYQGGLNIGYNGFTVGVAGEYYANGAAGGPLADNNTDAWTIGVGAAYTFEAWTVGINWTRGAYDIADTHDRDTLNVAALTGSYVMGPGITLDSELAWTGYNDVNNNSDKADYKSFQIGSGVNVKF